MLKEQITRKRILDKSYEMFQSYGYSKVTMEEIAQDLRISKKTLYKHFTNKEHVLRELISAVKCEIEARFEKIFSDESLDFIQTLEKVLDVIGENIRRMQGHLTQDLIKNHPDIWNGIQEFKRQKSHVQFKKLIEQGIKEGYIKADNNSQIIVMIYSAAIHEIMVPQVLSQVPLTSNQVYDEIIKTLFEGILSEKGRYRYVNLQLTSKDRKEVF
jgi:AcrR family transcriptional regulator